MLTAGLFVVCLSLSAVRLTNGQLGLFNEGGGLNLLGLGNNNNPQTFGNEEQFDAQQELNKEIADIWSALNVKPDYTQTHTQLREDLLGGTQGPTENPNYRPQNTRPSFTRPTNSNNGNRPSHGGSNNNWNGQGNSGNGQGNAGQGNNWGDNNNQGNNGQGNAGQGNNGQGNNNNQGNAGQGNAGQGNAGQGNNWNGQGNNNQGNGNNNGNGNNKVTKKPNRFQDKSTVSTTRAPRITTIATKPMIQRDEEPGNCKETETKVWGKQACAGQMIFEDQFDFMDRNKWTQVVRFAGSPDYEFVLYGKEPNNLNISEGNLIIQPTLLDDRYGDGYTTTNKHFDLGTRCTATKNTTDCVQSPMAYLTLPPVESGRLISKKSLNFKYGTVEIRAKLPKGDWIYPEIYLTPSKHEYGKDYESGSIVIAFLGGNSNHSTRLEGGVILGSSPAARIFGLKTIKSTRPWNDDFHTYSIKWRPDSISVYVDDEVYGKILPSTGGFATEEAKLTLKAADKWRKGGEFAPFDKEMYITLGVGVGGHVFRDNDNKPWINKDPKAQRKFYDAREMWKTTWGEDSKLQVDYITVKAL